MWTPGSVGLAVEPRPGEPIDRTLVRLRRRVREAGDLRLLRERADRPSRSERRRRKRSRAEARRLREIEREGRPR